MRDLIRLLDEIDTTALDDFAEDRRVWTSAPLPDGSKRWPVIRLNAIPVLNSPSVCRRVICDIGGYADVRAAIAEAKTDIIFARTKSGLLAFGSDDDIRKTLQSSKIDAEDLHTIEAHRLRFESGERGLLREALIRAITRKVDLVAYRKRSSVMLAPANSDDPIWRPLRKLVGNICGHIQDNPEIGWKEGVSTRLEWADDRLWLVFDPCTVFEGISADNRSIASDFGRERTVKRYNRQLNDIIAFWAGVLSAGGDEIKAFGTDDGVDAAFQLSKDTAFSRRVMP